MPRKPTSIAERAKALIAEGKQEEARELLLNAASGPEADAEARGAYEQLFPLTPRQKEWVSSTLSRLTSNDAAERAKAARDLCRKATDEATLEQRELIGDPRMMDYILAGFRSADPKVIECATVAISQAALFHYRDWRAWEPVLEQLKSKKPVTRRWAVEASGYLGRGRSLQKILPLLEDSDENVRDQVGRSLTWMLRSDVLTPADKQNLLEAFLPRLSSKKASDRSYAASVLGMINNPDALEPLKKALKSETGKEPKKWIDYAIRCLEAGNPELPM